MPMICSSVKRLFLIHLLLRSGQTLHQIEGASGGQVTSIIWEGHKAGRIRPYYQIEKLANLAALPPHGFMVSCFPVKIERASAGWIRAVAIVED
jgi:kynurenine formamidase